MRKILNILVISFFSVLSISENVGVCLVLPVLLIMSLHNYKNLIVSIPLSILSIFIFKKEYLYVCIIMYIFIIIYILIIKRKDKEIINGIIVFAFLLLMMIYIKNNFISGDLVWIVLISFISTIIFLILSISGIVLWFPK